MDSGHCQENKEREDGDQASGKMKIMQMIKSVLDKGTGKIEPTLDLDILG